MIMGIYIVIVGEFHSDNFWNFALDGQNILLWNLYITFL